MEQKTETIDMTLLKETPDTVVVGDIPKKSMFVALQNRDFRLLFFGLFVSNIGSWMQMVALGWLVFDITNSAFYLGLVGLCRAVPVFFFSLVGGTIADRLDRRHVMFWTQSSMGVMAAILGTVTLLGVRNVWLIIAIAIITSSLNSLDAPVRQSLIPELVPKAQRSNAIGLNSAQFNAAAVFGPSLAGLTLGLVGPGLCFLLNAVSFAAVVYSLILLKNLSGRVKRPTTSAWRNFTEGLSYVKSSPLVLTLLLLAIVPSLLARPYAQLMPVFARDVLHSNEFGLGMLTAASGVGAVGGGIMAAQIERFKRRGWVVLIAVTSFAICLLGFSLSAIYSLSIGLLIIVGWTLALYMSSVNTLLQTSVPDSLRGRVMGLYILVNLGFMPLGSMILGSVATLPGLSVPITLAGGCTITLIAVTLIGWRSQPLRRL